MKYILDRETLCKEMGVENANTKALDVLESIVPIIINAYNQGKEGKPLTAYPILEVE